MILLVETELTVYMAFHYNLLLLQVVEGVCLSVCPSVCLLHKRVS